MVHGGVLVVSLVDKNALTNQLKGIVSRWLVKICRAVARNRGRKGAGGSRRG